MIRGNWNKLLAGLLAAALTLASAPIPANAAEAAADMALEISTEAPAAEEVSEEPIVNREERGEGQEETDATKTPEESANERNANERSADKRSTEKRSANERSTEAYNTDECSTDECSTEAYRTGESGTDNTETGISADEGQSSEGTFTTEALEGEEAQTDAEDVTAESKTEPETEEETEVNEGAVDNKSVIGDDYPYKNACTGCHSDDVDPWSFYYRQCTSFAAWRLNSQNGVAFTNSYLRQHWGHAKNWGTAARNAGITVDNTPSVGSIWWSNAGTYGHVAWVAEVNGDQVTIEEYNWNPAYGYAKRTDLPASKATGYIHIKDIEPVVPDPVVPVERGSYMKTGYYQTIPDGDYHIVSSMGDNWWLTNAGFSKEDGGNVQLWDYSGMGIECDGHVYRFQFIDGGNGRGFYKITNLYSGKCLDSDRSDDLLYDPNTGKRTNVQQWTDCGSAGQQWAVSAIDGGDKGMLYTFQARCSGYYMDLEDGRTESGTNISMWTRNGSGAQQWRLVPYAPSIGQTIPDGEYQIVHYNAEHKAIGAAGNNIGNGTNVAFSSAYKGDYRHTFDVKYLGNGYYSIINKHSGFALDVADASRRLKANVQLWEYGAAYDAQKWIIRPCGNGYYNVISKLNGLCLDLDGSVEDGTNVQLWKYQKYTGLNWKFIPYEKPKLAQPTASIPSGTEVEKGAKLTLSCPGADNIYYTTDGTQPTTKSAQYSAQTGIAINTDITLKAFAVKEGYQDSDIVTYTYTVIPETSEEESSSDEESSSNEESSSGEEGSSTEESSSGEESSSAEESSSDEEPPSTEGNGDPNEEDIEGVKWHYSEKKVEAYKDLPQSGARITTNIKAKMYDGTPYKPAVKVTAVENGKAVTLTEGTDYRVVYTNNLHAGTGRVTVKGNGVYKGEIYKEFQITKKPCKKLKIVTSGMAAGSAAEPKVYVYDGGMLLKKGTDYTLEGVSAELAATKGRKEIYVVAAASSDYEGTAAANVTVYAADSGRVKGAIDNPDSVKLSQNAYRYTGKACKPTATVTVDGNTLEANKDYSIKYQNNTNAGTALVTVTGKGGYTGSVAKEFTIAPAGDGFALKKPIKPTVYNGKLQKPKATVTSGGKTLKQNKDYTVSYSNNLHATDKAKITVRGKGNYAGISKVFYFSITPRSISKVSVKGTQNSLVLTYANHTLVEGADYAITYGGAAGKNAVFVTIKAVEGGSFTGEMTKRISTKKVSTKRISTKKV